LLKMRRAFSASPNRKYCRIEARTRRSEISTHTGNGIRTRSRGYACVPYKGLHPLTRKTKFAREIKVALRIRCVARHLFHCGRRARACKREGERVSESIGSRAKHFWRPFRQISGSGRDFCR
jgi:hypothetical protein